MVDVHIGGLAAAVSTLRIPAYEHGVFPWTCTEHSFVMMGYGWSIGRRRDVGGPHQHRCPKCEGWIGCNQWPNGCPPDLEVSNMPKAGNGKVYDDE